MQPNRPYRKTARLVGDVLGKYHPHGDQALYDALVRLAQDFSMRYPVVDGQGNFGSVDGDPPAAMRYTEARLAPVSEAMLRDIGKDTVDFVPNYDDSLTEPAVLPAAFPYLLANGASGIAVGMATNIPPHNLIEVARATLALIGDPKLTDRDLMKHVMGPDFPTGGIIFGRKGIEDAYTTGKGKIVVRARVAIEPISGGREAIIVSELPYQVNKANLIVRIAGLVKERRLEGISDLRDESDRRGMRIVIEIGRRFDARIVLNRLFSLTQLQDPFHVNALALVGGKPQVLTLRDMVWEFIQHRRKVVTRRARFDLKKAEQRAHILEGLKIALDNIDEVVRIIRASRTVEIARSGLRQRFELSVAQAQAILDMRLQRLTSLETRKVEEELAQVRKLIAELRELLASEQKILDVIRKETSEIARRYGDDRRTEIVETEVGDFNYEDLIEEEDMVVVISNRGIIKRIPSTSYRRQMRGGKGAGSRLRGTDFISQIFIGSTHDYVLFITSAGRGYWLKVHELPERTRQTAGQDIRALLQMEDRRGRHRHRFAEQVLARGVSVHGDLTGGGEEGAYQRLRQRQAPRRGGDQPRLRGGRRRPRRSSGGRDADRRQARRDADRRFRQGAPLRGVGGAADGARHARGARHAPATRRPGGGSGDQRLSAAHLHHQRGRLRQAHGLRRTEPTRPRHHGPVLLSAAGQERAGGGHDRHLPTRRPRVHHHPGTGGQDTAAGRAVEGQERRAGGQDRASARGRHRGRRGSRSQGGVTHAFHGKPDGETTRRRWSRSVEEGILVGVLIGEGHFGGDGRQPHVTLRMHVDHEALFNWIVARFGGRLYGPYHHGGRHYYQWMARGVFLRDRLVPLLDACLSPELDERSYRRFTEMKVRYGIGA